MVAHAIVYDKTTREILRTYSAPDEAYVLSQPYDSETEELILLPDELPGNVQVDCEIDIETRTLTRKEITAWDNSAQA